MLISCRDWEANVDWDIILMTKFLSTMYWWKEQVYTLSLRGGERCI